jgi:hypothetical protein
MSLGIEDGRRPMEIGPTWIESGVDDPDMLSTTGRGEVNENRQTAELPHEYLRIGRMKQLVERLKPPGSATGMRQKSVDLMVTYQRTATDTPPDAKDLQRVGTSVDQITETPQLVLVRIESDDAEEFFELPRTALDVTDEPTHGTLRALSRQQQFQIASSLRISEVQFLGQSVETGTGG